MFIINSLCFYSAFSQADGIQNAATSPMLQPLRAMRKKTHTTQAVTTLTNLRANVSTTTANHVLVNEFRAQPELQMLVEPLTKCAQAQHRYFTAFETAKRGVPLATPAMPDGRIREKVYLNKDNL